LIELDRDPAAQLFHVKPLGEILTIEVDFGDYVCSSGMIKHA